ncbi:MAG: hypothetical protein RL238_2215 [Actinomycetota bacterium]|jgi:hypothetical protein
MLATFAVGQVLWSIFWFFLFFMWIMLVFQVFGDLFRDPELGGGAKVMWTLFIIILPFLGVFLYLIVRGKSMNERSVAAMKQQEAAFQQYVQQAAGTGGAASELAKLSELHDAGKLTDAEFAAMKAKLLA